MTFLYIVPDCRGIPLTRLILPFVSVASFSLLLVQRGCISRDKHGGKFSPGGGTLGISGWGCAAGSLEPLTFTRASSAEFCYPILE